MARKRIAILCLAVGLVVGAGVAGGIAETSGTRGDGPESTGSGSLAIAVVQRTSLAATTEIGGSIGYQGSYTVAAPSGATPEQVTQDQQAVTQDDQSLTADQAAETATETADDQAITSATDTADAAASTLSADQAQQTKDCAGSGASSAACSQDTQKVSQDQAQYDQDGQQVATAKDAAVLNHDQAQAKVDADRTQLQAAQTDLAQLETTAVNPGTTYTELPNVGQIITEDHTVYGVSDEPVPLLYGSVAAYRAFQPGMSAGADVGELTHDLIASGFGAGLAPSDAYSSATVAAVERWQGALGLPATGSILLGEVVFEPGPIRVTTVTPSVGQALGGGGSGGSGGSTVLTATGTTPIVTVDLDVTQEYLVSPGDAVTVVLPDGTTTVGGRVASVGDVATCPGGGSAGTGSSVADESPCSSSGSGSDSTPTVTVTVTLDSTPPGASLDQAPVNVEITTDRADNVLAVPVNALLALQNGGYGIDIVTDGATRLVGVTTGLYSNTLVQISGAGLSAGMQVEVPLAVTVTAPLPLVTGAVARPVLELVDVGKEYPGDPPVVALAGVDLRVDVGELVAIVGPSGSGKTTLLHVMGTLERPSSGVIRIAGEDTSTMSDRQLSGLRAQRLGFVFQQFFLLDGLSVLDNVADGLLYRGGRLAERRRLATAAIERVGLGHRIGHRPNQLSGGEQQRTAIARALAGRPALVMADEPTGNLDSVNGAAILELIRELHDEGTTIVVITHDHDVATAMDRRIEIRDGRVVSDTMA